MVLDLIKTQGIAVPGLPESLNGLLRLAYNLRWTWRPRTQAIFRQIAPKAWEANVNPVQILREVHDWTPFLELAHDINREVDALDSYLARPMGDWKVGLGPVAYFCAEYAIHTSMNQYAGGLGILAGDHCKETSDLGLPFVAVGLFYRRGFFHQMIDWSGRQEALYPSYDPVNLPLQRVLRPDSQEALTIELELPGRTVAAAVWLMAVGRTPLILLDTDLAENTPEDRKITSQVYTNWREMRVCQEFVLGVGGVRALSELGIVPSSYHLNEGHSAFLLLERLRTACEQGDKFQAARKVVGAHSVLSIHTPVPEGNERFDAKLVGELIKPLLAQSPFKPKQILELGLGADSDPRVFDMTAFALRHSVLANGVSLLHGKTADKTWREISGKKVIGVTNGVHMPTWIGPEMRSLFTRVGASFENETRVDVGPEARPEWLTVADIDGWELWRAHLAQKASLISWAENRLFETGARHGEGPSELARYHGALDPDAFLIGFARRFATYKRAWLLFSDLDKALRLLDAKGRKVQILFAGKSHPSDRGGQAVIEQVYALTQHPKLKGKVFLLEDYDMETGAKLVQGVDLWLNNPRRPLEASGTSGMKAAANGVPNASILDGWWDEAYVGGKHRNGWAIGDQKVSDDPAKQDERDAASLIKVLGKEVLPAFFDRNADGLPAQWVEVMKRSIATSVYSFSTARMIRDYVDEMYSVAGKR